MLAKREGLQALKTYQAERQKLLDQTRGLAKDAGKGVGKTPGGDGDRDKDRGLEFTKSIGPPKRPQGAPDDGHGR